MVRERLSEYETRYRILAAEVAAEIILANTPGPQTVEVPLLEAGGLVLAADAIAFENMPPFPSSSVDGYAVIASDQTAVRQVLGEITAGHPDELEVTPGTVARIMTGAPVPRGADAVVMLEATQDVGDGQGSPAITIDRAVSPGDYIHPVGQDLTTDQIILRAGSLLGPPEIGLLATIGLTHVRVFRRPVISVLSTGDELVEPDQALRPGAIRDSNRYALMSAVRSANCEARSAGMVRDSQDAQETAIRRALADSDVVLTSGGVSVGSRDLIKPILERLGTVHFGRIAMKPGKPLTFATVGQKLVFGLPGFPVSSLVTFEVFVRPALLKLQGRREVHRPRVEVVLAHDLKQTPDRTEYQRVAVTWENGQLVARGTGLQVSSRLLSMVGANALVVIQPGTGVISAGSLVPALLTGDILAT
ncbi:MAG TPA: gephyrin-like molybdotransferase Glp [Chloroflexota bacterium]|nr:gephyrin-like molybdotransferase Glp [Chloroflexota bacterium]